MDAALRAATIAAQIGAGDTFDAAPHQAGVPLRIPPLADVWLFSLSSTAHTLALRFRNSETFTTPSFTLPRFLPLDGTLIESVALDAADANVFYLVVAHGTPTPQMALASSVDFVTMSSQPSPIVSIVDFQDFDGSIANGATDAVKQAGATAIPVGALVTFRLSVGGNLATAADSGTYVALVGATTGKVYAKAYVSNSGGGEVTSFFRMPSNEKLDIHAANQDTVAHPVTAAWEASLGT